MIPLALGLQGAMGIASGIIGHKKRKQEQKDAQAEFEASRAQYMNQDLSNPYANMENTMEDLTVNQEEAQFVAEKQAQSQANILSDLRGAAGGSGIASLAQTLANQGSENARKAAISIGKQEQANQMKERQQAAAIQKAERQGEIMSRNMKQQEVQTLMGMAGQDVASAQQAVAAADQKMWSGIGQVGNVGMQVATGGIDLGGGVGGGATG